MNFDPLLLGFLWGRKGKILKCCSFSSTLLFQRGKKVACGSSEGTIYLFNWNGFGATSDRFAVKAESIDCMVPVTENVLCTGSIDGVIRLECLVTPIPPRRAAGKGGFLQGWEDIKTGFENVR